MAQEMEGVGKYKLRPDPINVLDLQLTEKQIKSACACLSVVCLSTLCSSRRAKLVAALSVRGVAKSQPRWALIAPRETWL